MSDDRRRRLVWLRFAVLAVLLTAGTALVVSFGVPSTTELRAIVRDWGSGAPILFVLLHAVATLAPVPKAVFSAVRGALFGLWWGLLLVYVAAVAGAMMAFAVG